jgi:hypothetical protein
MLRFKDGVSLSNMQPQVVVGLILAEQAFATVGAECVVTSVNDGAHTTESFHYSGLAADLRIKHVHPNQRQAVVARLGDLLGPEWDVLWEAKGTDNEHVHIEWDIT